VLVRRGNREQIEEEKFRHAKERISNWAKTRWGSRAHVVVETAEEEVQKAETPSADKFIFYKFLLLFFVLQIPCQSSAVVFRVGIGV